MNKHRKRRKERLGRGQIVGIITRKKYMTFLFRSLPVFAAAMPAMTKRAPRIVFLSVVV